MAKDYRIHTILNTQRKVTVEVIGETPEAKQRGVRKYFDAYGHFGYDTRITFETSTTCQITRATSCD